jgi:hypothetical protein
MYDFDVKILKKTDPSLAQMPFIPKFPAVDIDGNLISEDREISIDELENAITMKKGD